MTDLSSLQITDADIELIRERLDDLPMDLCVDFIQGNRAWMSSTTQPDYDGNLHIDIQVEILKLRGNKGDFLRVMVSIDVGFERVPWIRNEAELRVTTQYSFANGTWS